MTTSAQKTTSERFAPGTFAPAPKRASAAQMIASQGRIEATLLLRHGEQILVNLIIPAAILIGASLIPVLGENATLDQIVTMVFSIAAASAGFTGQAISLAFDRRYGALKRTGASGVPAWTIIAGKVLGVLATVLVQIIVLGGIALALGWRISLGGAVLGFLTLLAGVTAFTALGLLLGGTQSSEVVLAGANFIWLLLLAILGWVVYSDSLSDAGVWNLVPSVALASAMDGALSAVIHPWAWLALIAWAIFAIAGTIRWFKFDG
ncbi:ABC transporter permease [uncultured Corynebacterium sp.]|uniref:ABC transporter permease n=1 Tax=uncultured Corynebacterium sp. TaxID=159447 RepID=UPI00260A04CB|nr:ABC transporter permease [uncultured Corynebacterium sp.]